MATEWYRNDNGLVSGKIAGKKHIEGRMKIGESLVINSIILRVSYVYVTYIIRIWYVIEKGNITGRSMKRNYIRILHLLTLMGRNLNSTASMQNREQKYEIS